MEKLFNEIAPKYAQRKEELGQGGGYTRIYLLGQRRGDGAEEAIPTIIISLLQCVKLALIYTCTATTA